MPAPQHQQPNDIDARSAALADEVLAAPEAPVGTASAPGALTIPPEIKQLSKEALTVLIKFLLSRLGV